MRDCPGQDMRYWSPEDVSEVECGQCGHMLEFFKTEGRRRCPECGTRVINPAVSLGCAQWCEHAEECLGFDPSSTETEEEGETSVADRLIERVKEQFGEDQEQISHALRVLDHAEEIMQEEDGSPRVVIAAALLHDIGVQEAARKHGSAEPTYQEREGPPIARDILEELDFGAKDTEHVCQIIAHHHSGWAEETPEFRIVWDADRLVNFPEEYGQSGRDERESVVERMFKTHTGRSKAMERFVGSEPKAKTNPA